MNFQVLSYIVILGIIAYVGLVFYGKIKVKLQEKGLWKKDFKGGLKKQKYIVVKHEGKKGFITLEDWKKAREEYNESS